MYFIHDTLAAIINEPMLLQFLSRRVRLSFWLNLCSNSSSKSSASQRALPSLQNSSGDQHLGILHQVVQCDSSGHSAIISRSFKPGIQTLAEGFQALLSSSIESSAIFKDCLIKLWRLGFAEFRSLDRMARATREGSANFRSFSGAWDSSMGQVIRLLQNIMSSCSVLLQRSESFSSSAKSAIVQAVVLPALSSAGWLSDINQVISVAPLPMTRGLHQSASALVSRMFQNAAHAPEVTREARITQLIRDGIVVKLQVGDISSLPFDSLTDATFRCWPIVGRSTVWTIGLSHLALAMKMSYE
jgi:hypothetical protein